VKERKNGITKQTTPKCGRKVIENGIMLEKKPSILAFEE
jgi:hypothetical protein